MKILGKRKKRRMVWLIGGGVAAIIAMGAFLYFPFLFSLITNEQKTITINQERWLYWCKKGPGIEERQCYYVNRDGIVANEAPSLRGNLFPKLYDERNAGGDERIIEENLLAFVRRFYDFGQFIVKDDETLEIGWPGTMRITLSFKDDPERVAENLALILEKEIGDRRNEVDYIDLRFGNRVYYKLKK